MESSSRHPFNKTEGAVISGCASYEDVGVKMEEETSRFSAEVRCFDDDDAGISLFNSSSSLDRLSWPG